MVSLRYVIVLVCFLVLQNLATGSKIHPSVKNALAKNNQANVLVQCENATDVKIQETIQKIKSTVSASSNRRTDLDCTDLTTLINKHQSLISNALFAVTSILDLLNISYKSFWMASAFYIPNASELLINSLAELDIVLIIRLEEFYQVRPIDPKKFVPKSSKDVSWNLDLINARCNGIGCYGDGVVVGIIDTGVRWDHEQLKINFRNDNYSWWNPYSAPVSRYPVDDESHGTHVAGTAVGKTIGVASNAFWMACKGCNILGLCPDSQLLECLQYMAAPWRWDDATPNKITKDACKRPHVINNSWSVDGVSGAQTMYPSQNVYYKLIEYWNLLGILSVFAAGNTGPGCGSLVQPGSFQNTLGIGAVDKTVTIAYFSARGPGVMAEDFPPDSVSSEGGSCSVPPALETCTNATLSKHKICQYVKPDVVAPGVDVVSSYFTGVNDYISFSGTSMATPHVAGVIALMLCTNLGLRWEYKDMYKIIRETVDVSRIDLMGDGSKVTKGNFAKGSNILCNFVATGICNKYPVYPNNVYGKGLANACKAVEYSKKITANRQVK